MTRARAGGARRRRLALAVLGGAAAAAFALGAALGDGAAPRVETAARLPIGQLAGERIVTGLGGSRVSPALQSAIRSGRIAGVVLFAGNFPSRAAGERFVTQLQDIRRPPLLRDPLLIMVDQEGGEVKRVSGAPTVSAAQMGARGAAFSAAQGRRTAANLRGLGVNVDLAPVLDVGRPGGVIAATERSFGATAGRVESTAVAFAGALQAGGVAATAKHFPGFGAARQNTDISVERVDLPKRTLQGVDEAPFRSFAAAGGRLVMIGTAIYPAFSPRPAAFSRPIATGELRDRIGFGGVSISDTLESAAVRDFGGPGRSGIAAARAGTDLLLFTKLGPSERAWSALVAGLRGGRLERARFEASAQRVLDLRAELPR